MGLLFLCLICFHITIAQFSQQIFEHLTTDHGLSSNKVEAILQDREGFFWIATQNGLNRFDGTSFKTFYSKAHDSTSLTHNHCTSLLEDINGDIWIGTFNGVSRYVRKTAQFQQVIPDPPRNSTETWNIIRDIKADREGNIWVAGAALWKYDLKTDALRIFQPDAKGSISNDKNIFEIAYDPVDNGLWIAPGGNINYYSIPKDTFYSSLYNPYHWKIFDYDELKTPVIDEQHTMWCYDSHTRRLIAFNPDHNRVQVHQQISTSSFRKLIIDANNLLWILDWDGHAEVIDLNSSLSSKGLFEAFHPQNIKSEFVRGVFADRQNNYWVTSADGINIYDLSHQYYSKHTIIPVSEKVKNKLVITSMAQISPERFAVATNQGLFEYDLEDRRAKLIKSREAFTKIKALYVDKNFLYIGSRGKLIRMDLSNHTTTTIVEQNSSIIFIFKVAERDLWVGFWNNGFCKIDTRTQAVKYFTASSMPGALNSNALVSGYADSSCFWVGYNSGKGFSKLDLSGHSIGHFQPVTEGEHNINRGTITAISGTHNALWLGTYGGGIFYFDPSMNTYKNFTQEHGLSSNYINSIVPDKKGNLWITTADGLDLFNPVTNHISHIDIELASSSNDVNPNGFRGLIDKLFFFSNDYFVEIDPSAYMEMHDSSHLVISHFKVFDKEMIFDPESPAIHLSHHQNFFTFEFSALRTHPDKPVHYAYRLEGFDTGWNDAGNKNFASYTNVPGGNYVFQVRTKNHDGQWSNALINVPVIVKPPFWLTWWFILLVITLLTAIFYSIYRYRINHLRKIYSIKSKISQDLHDDVGASLSSIHIFSSVAEDAIQNNPQKAGMIVQQIKHNSRQVMENMSDIIWAMNAEQNSTESFTGRIKNYGYDLLSIKNIECTYKIDPQVEKKLRKPEARKNILLIVKEALNNIAKYSDATRAEVNINMSNSDLHINILDNGKGFDISSLNGGNGLKNMKLRAVTLGGNCHYVSAPGKGTRIESNIPLANISDG